MSLYNRTAISPHTRATAEDINAELIKIASAFDQIEAQVDGIEAGTGVARYNWTAYADSADGTSNFTTGEPANREYIGQAFNKTVEAESSDPADYVWTKLRGDDGAGANYQKTLYLRSYARPAQPTGASPAGWGTDPGTGSVRLWMVTATFNADDVPISAWSTPINLTGRADRVAYEAGTTYYRDDTVPYGGGTYVLIVESSTGNAPSGTANANAWWDVVAAPGSAGEPGTPPSGFSATIDLTTSSSGANLRTLADAAGYTGLSDATITFRVPNTVTVRGLGGENGGIGIDSGVWPSGYVIALTLIVQNGGLVDGGGGSGGAGGYGAAGSAGGKGGDAIYLRTPMSGGITIDAGGTVRGGGGGGGGGSGSANLIGGEWIFSGGGGGGGGAPNGAGGAGGMSDYSPFVATSGSAGTTSGGGSGGAGLGTGSTAGANGGGFAAAGSNSSGAIGGAAGYAVRKNGFAATVTNNGTMTGTAG